MLKNPWALRLLKGNHRRPQIFPLAKIFRRSQGDGSLAFLSGDHSEQKKLVTVLENVRIAAVDPAVRPSLRPIRCLVNRISGMTLPLKEILTSGKTDGLLTWNPVVKAGVEHVIESIVLDDRGSGNHHPFPALRYGIKDPWMVLPSLEVLRSRVPESLFVARFEPLLILGGLTHIIKKMEGVAL